MSSVPGLGGVILAAGESTRMGRDKALLPWPPAGAGGPSGQTFLTAAIESFMPFTEMVIVVSGKNTSNLAPVVYANGAQLAENPDPARGQFSSLQVGLHEVMNRGRDAAMVTLVDRPPASGVTLQTLIDSFAEALGRRQWAVVPEFEGKHGHPILIGREMIEHFLRAPATATARDIEHRNQQHIIYLPVSDPFVTMNVDTPEQYAALAVTTANPRQ